VCQRSPQVNYKNLHLSPRAAPRSIGRGRPPICEMLVFAALHESGSGPLPTRTCARTCPQLAKADAALRNSRSRILYSLREREPGSRCRWRPAGASPVPPPATVTANGTSATTLAVTVDDANGNPVAGTAVTLSASGSGNTFGSVSGTTNASGSAVRPSAV
jgi:Bacterial Ig-like domain (group 1)